MNLQALPASPVRVIQPGPTLFGRRVVPPFSEVDMRIVLEIDDLRAAVEAYVRAAMGIEYENANVVFPVENCEWDGTASIGESPDD